MSNRIQDVSSQHCFVVIPIRSFSGSKLRLAPVLDDNERSALVERLATGVLRACEGHPTVVVTSDPDVEELALRFGSVIVQDPGSLNGAANAGREFARSRGADRCVILHADLAYIDGIEAITATCDPNAVLIVPDQRLDGTPAISVPTFAAFEFSYGPGSFDRHLKNAEAAGLESKIVSDESLGFDVDLPEDLAAMFAKERSK